MSSSFARQAVGVVPELGLVDANDLGVACLDDLSKPRPLLVVERLVHVEKALIIKASDGEALDTLRSASIEEDENRSPSRGVSRQGRHRAEDWMRCCTRA